MAKKKTRKKEPKPKTAGLTATWRELDLAYKRIDGNPIRRLRWLLDFTYSDLDSMSQGKLADVAWEVVAFGVNNHPKKRDVEKFLQERHEQEAEATVGQTPTVSFSLVRTFQGNMKLIFDELYRGLSWEFTYPRKTKLIAIPHIQGPKGYVDDWDLTAWELLMVQAFELVEAEKDRLLICENPRCQRKFVATKEGRSRFHSPTCSAYVRIARSRGKKI